MPVQRFGRWLLEHGYTRDVNANPIKQDTIYNVVSGGVQPCSEVVQRRKATTTKTKKR